MTKNQRKLGSAAICLILFFALCVGHPARAVEEQEQRWYHYDNSVCCIRCTDVVLRAEDLRETEQAQWQSLVLERAALQILVRDNRDIHYIDLDCSQVQVSAGIYPVFLYLPELGGMPPVQFRAIVMEDSMKQTERDESRDGRLQEHSQPTPAPEQTPAQEEHIPSAFPDSSEQKALASNQQSVLPPSLWKEMAPAAGVSLLSPAVFIQWILILSDIRVLLWYRAQKKAFRQRENKGEG